MSVRVFFRLQHWVHCQMKPVENNCIDTLSLRIRVTL